MANCPLIWFNGAFDSEVPGTYDAAELVVTTASHHTDGPDAQAVGHVDDFTRTERR
jgi:hypothetical protein